MKNEDFNDYRKWSHPEIKIGDIFKELEKDDFLPRLETYLLVLSGDMEDLGGLDKTFAYKAAQFIGKDGVFMGAPIGLRTYDELLDKTKYKRIENISKAFYGKN
jgi:hypothetical protein